MLTEKSLYTLSHDEVIEAVTEWLVKRGKPVPPNALFDFGFDRNEMLNGCEVTVPPEAPCS